MVEILSKKWLAGILAEDEDDRVGGWMKQQQVFDEDVANLKQIEAGLRGSLARGDFALVEASAGESRFIRSWSGWASSNTWKSGAGRAMTGFSHN